MSNFGEKYPNVTRQDWLDLLKSRSWSRCRCKEDFYIKLVNKEFGIKIDKSLIR